MHSRFAIILKRKRKLVDLLLLSYRCIVTINVPWLFLTVPWVGLQCVIVVFSDHSHLLFYSQLYIYIQQKWVSSNQTSLLLFVMFIVNVLLSHLVSWDRCGT